VHIPAHGVRSFQRIVNADSRMGEYDSMVIVIDFGNAVE